MSRLTFLILLATPAIVAWAQSASYQAAVPAPSTFSSYGGYYGGTYGGGTVAGSAMQGMASVISAQGNYNLATSAAAVNMTQAQKQHIQNRQQWTNTYFEMRATNRAARAAERGPPPTKEQVARIAAQGVPKPLSSADFDPVSGELAWPTLLQDDSFAQQRAQVEEILAKQAHYGGLGLSDRNQVGVALETIANKLREQVRNVPPQEYITSTRFLKSLMYSVTGNLL